MRKIPEEREVGLSCVLIDLVFVQSADRAAAELLIIFSAIINDLPSCPSVFINHPLLSSPCPTICRQKAESWIRRWKASSPSSLPCWTSVSAVLAAAPTLTPPDGEPAGSAEVLPTEVAGITPPEWSPTLVFCTVPCFLLLDLSLFALPTVTSPVLGLVTLLEAFGFKRKCSTTNLSGLFLIYRIG